MTGSRLPIIAITAQLFEFIERHLGASSVPVSSAALRTA
jgi:hypothetical protein